MAERIKILQTIRQGKIGGGERHVIDLVESLDKSVFEPIVLSFTDGEMITHLKKIGIEVHVIHTEKGFDYSIWPKVKQLIKEKNIQLVHAHGTRACSNSFWPAKQSKVPVLYTVHGWSFHNDQVFFQKKLRTFFEGILIKQVDATILVSDNNGKEAEEMFSPKKKYVIKNGVNLNRFTLGLKNTIREELAINSDTFLVGFIARMTKQKDPLSIVHAMKIVAEETDKIKLLMVGSGELDGEVSLLIQNLGLNNIIRQPFRSDVPELLTAIDVYCLPSLWEGLPIGILEAMAMAKPIIASEITGNSELVESGKNGFLFSKESPQSLAEKILLMYSLETKNRIEMGRYSRDRIEKSFSILKMTKEIEGVYMSFLS